MAFPGFSENPWHRALLIKIHCSSESPGMLVKLHIPGAPPTEIPEEVDGPTGDISTNLEAQS